jgi:WD40 repeat protein
LEAGWRTISAGSYGEEITSFSTNEIKGIEYNVNDNAIATTTVDNIIREQGEKMKVETFSELLMTRKFFLFSNITKICYFGILL